MTSKEVRELLRAEVENATREYNLAKRMFDLQVAGERKYTDDEYPKWTLCRNNETFNILDYPYLDELIEELTKWKKKQIEENGNKPFFKFSKLDAYGNEECLERIEFSATWEEPWANFDNKERAKDRIVSRVNTKIGKILAMQIWPELKKYDDERFSSWIRDKYLELLIDKKISYEVFVELNKSQCFDC
jgi:hypothetical protein